MLFRSEHGEARRVREHVEDEQLELHPVRLGGLDELSGGNVDMWNLLAGDMVC